MLVSTHDMKLVGELSPHMIVTDEGLSGADGKTKELLQDEKYLNKHELKKLYPEW